MLTPRNSAGLGRGTAAAGRRSRGGLPLVVALCGGVLIACGGGGGSGARAPDGFRGTLRLQGAHLGQISEMEPNDTHVRPARLPPIWADTTFIVSGTVASTAAAWGRVDPVDCHALRVLVDQPMRLSLDFDETAPGGGANDVELAWLTVAGELVGSQRGSTSPLMLQGSVVARTRQVLRVTVFGGATSYRLTVRAGASASGMQAPRVAWQAAAADQAPEGPRAPSTEPARPRCATEHVVVRFREGVRPTDVAQRHGLSLGRRLGGGAYCAHLPSHEALGEEQALACAASLDGDRDVSWAEPDWRVHLQSVPDDSRFAEQWNLRVIGAPAAWDSTTGASTIVVGIVDTGIVDHPDFEGQVVGGYDFITSSEIAADGDGRDDDPTDEGDQLLPSGFSTWHGSHVAGIVAAKQNDAFGMSGVAPGCRVMPLRVVGRRGGLSSDAADAILYGAGLYAPEGAEALSEPLPILNLSIGVAQDAAVLREACARAEDAGVLLVAAVGNGYGAPPLYPAAYPSVLGVAAVDSDLVSASYSNVGPGVAIAAPGGTYGQDIGGSGWTDPILSVVLDETVHPARAAHTRLAGTSQASPHVAGAAALLCSLAPTISPAELRALLTTTARDVGATGHDDAHGAGLLQVHRAVEVLLARLGTPPITPGQLALPFTSLRLQGDDNLIELPVQNAGTLRLDLQNEVVVTTVDGGGWLGASLNASTDAQRSHDSVLLAINRALLPEFGEWFTGHVVLHNLLGEAVGRIEVVAARDAFARMGNDLQVAVIDAERVPTFAPRIATGTAENNYRFWVRDLPRSSYVLRGGEDLDRDGFFCEPTDRCGYHGGPTVETATPLAYEPRFPAGAPTDVELTSPSAP